VTTIDKMAEIHNHLPIGNCGVITSDLDVQLVLLSKPNASRADLRCTRGVLPREMPVAVTTISTRSSSDVSCSLIALTAGLWQIETAAKPVVADAACAR
jgi:hypothetical protein